MLTKYASAKVLDCSTDINIRTAKKTVGSFDYEPRTDHKYMYVSVRACTADVPNLNYDMLPDKELKTAYRTFIGSYVYLNHDNTDPRKARGAIIDAKYHTEDPDDKWIEILMEMDEEKCPKLCSLIRSGEIDTVSMGCNIESSTCSVCGNTAEYPFEYCTHIQQKGQTFGDKLAYEICNGIEFFECSWVFDPADPTAHVQALEKEAMKKSAGKMVSRGCYINDMDMSVTIATFDIDDSFDVEIDSNYGYKVFTHKDVPVTAMGWTLLKEYVCGDVLEVTNGRLSDNGSDEIGDMCIMFMYDMTKAASSTKTASPDFSWEYNEDEDSWFCVMKWKYGESDSFAAITPSEEGEGYSLWLGTNDDFAMSFSTEYDDVVFATAEEAKPIAEQLLEKDSKYVIKEDYVEQYVDIYSDEYEEILIGYDEYFSTPEDGIRFVEDIMNKGNNKVALKAVAGVDGFDVADVNIKGVRLYCIERTRELPVKRYEHYVEEDDETYVDYYDAPCDVSVCIGFNVDVEYMGKVETVEVVDICDIVCSQTLYDEYRVYDNSVFPGYYELDWSEFEYEGEYDEDELLYRFETVAHIALNRLSGLTFETFDSFVDDFTETMYDIIEGKDVSAKKIAITLNDLNLIQEDFVAPYYGMDVSPDHDWLMIAPAVDGLWGWWLQDVMQDDIDFSTELFDSPEKALEDYKMKYAKVAEEEKSDSFANTPRKPDAISTGEDATTCPLCGSDVFDGEYCNICGYQAPPEGFDDIKLESEEDYEKYENESEYDDPEDEEASMEKEAAVEKMYDISDDPQLFINICEEEGFVGCYDLIGFDIIKTDDEDLQEILEYEGAIEL